MARRNGGKGWGGARTRPRAGRRTVCCRGHIVGQRGGDPRENPGHAGEASMLDGQGHFGVQYRRSIPSSSHSNMPPTTRPAHRATLRLATASSPVRRRSQTDCRPIAPGEFRKYQSRGGLEMYARGLSANDWSKTALPKRGLRTRRAVRRRTRAVERRIFEFCTNRWAGRTGIHAGSHLRARQRQTTPAAIHPRAPWSKLRLYVQVSDYL